eukprot:Tbor_TRINITY_DN5768_c3_g4::TRINITY_DN5768_c3_g4_i1::g.19581::m.19581
MNYKLFISILIFISGLSVILSSSVIFPMIWSISRDVNRLLNNRSPDNDVMELTVDPTSHSIRYGDVVSVTNGEVQRGYHIVLTEEILSSYILLCRVDGMNALGMKDDRCAETFLDDSGKVNKSSVGSSGPLASHFLSPNEMDIRILSEMSQVTVVDPVRTASYSTSSINANSSLFFNTTMGTIVPYSLCEAFKSDKIIKTKSLEKNGKEFHSDKTIMSEYDPLQLLFSVSPKATLLGLIDSMYDNGFSSGIRRKSTLVAYRHVFPNVTEADKAVSEGDKTHNDSLFSPISVDGSTIKTGAVTDNVKDFHLWQEYLDNSITKTVPYLGVFQRSTALLGATANNGIVEPKETPALYDSDQPLYSSLMLDIPLLLSSPKAFPRDKNDEDSETYQSNDVFVSPLFEDKM